MPCHGFIPIITSYHSRQLWSTGKSSSSKVMLGAKSKHTLNRSRVLWYKGDISWIKKEFHGTNDNFINIALQNLAMRLWPEYLKFSKLPSSGQVSVGLQWCKKRWEEIKHKHSTLGVSTHLTKCRQKVFNDDADPVGVSLQHVALTSFHPVSYIENWMLF